MSHPSYKTERDLDEVKEISKRIADTLTTWKTLEDLWKRGNAEIREKVKVFDAVIRSKLLYAMETIQLTTAELARTDAFQTKGIRRVLGIPPPT